MASGDGSEGAAVPEGTIVGERYRIVRPLGKGGMSSVFVADDLKRPDRQRAVKVMASFLLRDGRSRERFEQEALIGRAIKHPNIVDVLAAGVDRTLGSPWIAMELLSGRTLEDTVNERGPLPPSEVRGLFADFASAIAAAHQMGAIHRDLKPENLFLSSEPSRALPYTVKVLDFGLAKIRKDVTALNSQVMGTPMWMAPEQMTPGSAIAPCTDVWPFGLIAFFALAGKPYWKTANDRSMNLPKLFAEIVADDIVAPSERAAQLGVKATLPPGFDTWFLHCVARDGAARFPTITDAAGALDRILAAIEPPPVAPPVVVPATPSSTESALPPIPRPSVAPVVIGVAGIVIVLVAAIAWIVLH